MSHQDVVSELVDLIWSRFPGASDKHIESTLVGEGWAIGTVREAISTYRSCRQFI